MADKMKDMLKDKIKVFQERSWKHDEEGSFPRKNIQDLREIGYTSLTVPKKYGGEEISLRLLVEFQKILGKGDGSTSLSIGWHMGLVKHLHEQQSWKEEIYEAFCKDVIDNGALLNNAASEPATGSPTRGGKPETTAKDNGDTWIINGRKTFTTMSPVLNYFGVSASIEGTDEVGNFLIPRESKGLSIEETWDSIAMRGTASNDLVLQNVSIKKELLVENINIGSKAANGWLLHIPACYLGIAEAAQQYAIDFAKSYSPNSIKGTIADLPNVKQKIGEMELKRLQSEHFLFSMATKWDESDHETRQQMKAELGAVKHAVVNQAIEIVDLAMRIVGAKSLSMKNPLQRYYRDIRAGLHNPPMDDMTIMLLATDTIKKEE
ncbi:acyl-CoA dehydrogenase [Salipaludibacillus neizhouensis]|uniref:Acyl-CoA dehydrogenase n=1 Tax=Salipaludibacillus neizhouensis TaxID=885475 RepID=A0A3A9K375_9BACI|nr:acyl-CoA dehydrogenase family protein [Salipaludibacillus neizhouensis]RKL67127.1 acyl-CoA dehydrogenase [Salipaludibacillus neizhouensis]